MKTAFKQYPVRDIVEGLEYNEIEGKGVMKTDLSQIPENGCNYYSLQQAQQARTTRFRRCS